MECDLIALADTRYQPMTLDPEPNEVGYLADGGSADEFFAQLS
jgi:hypothetical protein